MSILSTNSRLIKVGQDYSAGSGISINDYVISVTGDSGATYSAGENVSIYEQDEQLYISSKDWTNDIANASANAYEAATAQIPEPQDLSYISSKVDDKLDSTAFTNWQTGQYTTDLQTIEGQITNKLDTSSFSEVSASFLTAINIPESATWNEVSTTVQSNSAQWADGGSGDEEVNSFVYNNSATIVNVDTTYQQNSASYLTAHQDISNKLDTTSFSTVSGDFLTAAPADMATTGDIADLAQSVSETYYPNTNPSSFVNGDWVTAQGYITGVDLSEYAKRAFVLSSIESATSGKLDVSSFASVSSDFLTTSFGISESAGWNDTTNVVQTNSANWGNETISSYTTAYSHDIPPYGGEVINSLNGKFISAFISKNADNAKVATNANSATYAQTVNETYLENQGFARNLSSEYGTISVVRNTIESTNSAISRVGNEGFVSSFQDESIGPSVTATFNWDKSLPNTTFNFHTDYAPNNTKVTYSANTNLTGEVTVTSVGELQFSVDVPNATELSVWSNEWVQIKNNVASAADTFETVIGELAWASALPTYEYDSTNKISAINGSAIAAGDEFPASANEAITAYQNASATYLTAHQAISADEWNDCYDNVNTNSGVWGGSALPISAGPGIKFEMVDNTLVASTSGYVWQSASLFHTDSPVTQTNYTMSDNCSNYDKLEVDFYDINNWRTQMDCPIPPNLAASGTRGGYFSVVPQDTTTGSNIWFKAFNWTASNTTWTCYCSEIAAQGGSTTQTVNANQPSNPPKVINIIGWKRIGG